MTKHYMMSPLPRATNLFANALKMNVHRQLYTAKEPGAAAVIPVFINGTQRRNFLALAKKYLESCPLVNFNERSITQWLVDGATEEGDFPFRIPSGQGEDRVLYIEGHGAPGVAALSDDADNTIIDLEGIADILYRIDAVPTDITLKCNSCYSGIDNYPVFDSLGAVQDWLASDAGSSAFYTANSFAAALRKKLRQHRGMVYGYIGSTSVANPLMLMQPNGTYAYNPHMEVALGYKDAFDNVNYFYIKKSRGRVLFPWQEQEEERSWLNDIALFDD